MGIWVSIKRLFVRGRDVMFELEVEGVTVEIPARVGETFTAKGKKWRLVSLIPLMLSEVEERV